MSNKKNWKRHTAPLTGGPQIILNEDAIKGCAAAERGRKALFLTECYGVYYRHEGHTLVMGFRADEEAKAYAFAESVGGEVVDWA